MDTIRRVLNKDDKEAIAEYTKTSYRTVQAVLQGDRVNNDIEKASVKRAWAYVDSLIGTLSDIERHNAQSLLTVNGFNEALKSETWCKRQEYYRYMDVYLALVHNEYKNFDELWAELKNNYYDVIRSGYYCIALVHRLLGISIEQTLINYNKLT
jgi:hypothetical protein